MNAQKITLCKQKLTIREKEVGIRCIDCNRIITDDVYYVSRQLTSGISEVVCVDCGLKRASSE